MHYAVRNQFACILEVCLGRSGWIPAITTKSAISNPSATAPAFCSRSTDLDRLKTLPNSSPPWHGADSNCQLVNMPNFMYDSFFPSNFARILNIDLNFCGKIATDNVFVFFNLEIAF